MNKLLYLSDTYLFTCEARIISKNTDDKGNYIVLDQTNFYPQGGGQPSDQGIIKADSFELNIISVKQIEQEIRHYYLGDYSHIALNDLPVMCSLDINRRLLNARYHTAAHILGHVVEMIYPSFKATKGHSFPRESYIEFQMNESSNTLEPQNMSITIKKEIDLAFKANHKAHIFYIEPRSFEKKFYKLPYLVADDKIFRVVQFGNYPPTPCGGTHLSSTNEIGNLQIGKIKVKRNTLHISYEVL